MCALMISLVMQLIGFLFFMTMASNQTAITMYAAGGIVIYGIYVIIDLKYIAERIEVDDYILGALTLYIDLMSLFIYLLQFLGSKK